MATTAECERAIVALAARFVKSDGDSSGGLDRSVSAEITDLGVVFHAHMHDGVLDEITTEPGPKAQIRMAMKGDDLVALAAGELALAPAWMTGRIKVQASFPDLMRLRNLV